MMTTALDQKTYWGIGETVMWIRIRDHERVAAMSDLSEEEAMVLAMFAFKAQWDLRSLLDLPTNPDADRNETAPQDKDKSLRIDGPVLMPPDQALDDLHRKLRSRRLPLTAIRCDGNNGKRTPVPTADLNDLIVSCALSLVSGASGVVISRKWRRIAPHTAAVFCGSRRP